MEIMVLIDYCCKLITNMVGSLQIEKCKRE